VETEAKSIPQTYIYMTVQFYKVERFKYWKINKQN